MNNNSYIQGMEEIFEEVDKKKYKLIRKGLSDYERNKEDNNPTHFSKTLITEGRLKGFDNINYYRKVKL